MQDQASSSIAANSLPSSSERSSSSALHFELKEGGMESDEEIRRVPEIGGESAGTSVSGKANGSVSGSDRVQTIGDGQRRKGRSTADKESKRLKRLLRNRVSAQQARERKKAYVSELETRVKDLEKHNSELEERLSTLQNENQMLRQKEVWDWEWVWDCIGPNIMSFMGGGLVYPALKMHSFVDVVLVLLVEK